MGAVCSSIIPNRGPSLVEVRLTFTTDDGTSFGEQRLYDLWERRVGRGELAKEKGALREALSDLTLDDVSQRLGLHPKQLSVSTRHCLSEAALVLTRMSQVMDLSRELSNHCREWASDSWVLIEQWERALELTKDLVSHGGRSMWRTERSLAIKTVASLPLEASDVMALFGPHVTEWGQAHLQEIEGILQGELESAYSDLTHELSVWAERSPKDEYPYYFVYEGRAVASLIQPRFSQETVMRDWVREATRSAENEFRRINGLPSVGEGWISETELFYALDEAFEDLTVRHHYRPSWLDGLELDIYIEELKVGIEYQGPQHDEPVEFFGGKKAHHAQRRRDEQKRRLCELNEVVLFEVRKGYHLDQVVESIRLDGASPDSHGGE